MYIKWDIHISYDIQCGGSIWDTEYIYIYMYNHKCSLTQRLRSPCFQLYTMCQKPMLCNRRIYCICHIWSYNHICASWCALLLLRSSHTRPPSPLNFFKMRELCYTNHASWFKLGLGTIPGGSQERCHTAGIYCQNIKFCWIVDDARRCHWPSLFLLETCNQNQTSCDFCRDSSQPPINSEPGLQHYCHIIHCVLYRCIPRCPCYQENFQRRFCKSENRGPSVDLLSPSLGLSWYHLVQPQQKPGLTDRTVCIWNTLECQLLTVWRLHVFRIDFSAIGSNLQKQIDQYAELSIFCSGVSDLVFLHATPPSHLGPWQLWKILCRRFRTWSNDSKIECSFGSADEWWVRLQSEALCIGFSFVLSESRTGP